MNMDEINQKVIAVMASNSNSVIINGDLEYCMLCRKEMITESGHLCIDCMSKLIVEKARIIKSESETIPL